MANNTSFLPDDYLAKRVERRTNLICLVLFVLVVAGIGSVGWVTYQRQLTVHEQQRQVNKRFEKARQRLDQLEKLRQKKQRMIRKARVTAALVERVPRSTLLAELINHMPAELSLLDLELTSKALNQRARPTTAIGRQRQSEKPDDAFEVDVKPKQLTVHLVGVAPSDVQVSQYMTALGQYPLFSDVSLRYSEQVTMNDNTLRKFRVRIGIANDVTVRDLEPTKVARELKQNPMSDKVRINDSGQLIPASSETPAKPNADK
jgi:Tfp pilus assembly protein PilN